MDQVIKEFHGHSGSKVYLMKKNDDTLYVRKIGNIERNIERLNFLNERNFPVPKIHIVTDEYLDMEYLHGLDMKTYLIHNMTDRLSCFLTDLIKKFQSDSNDLKDYSEVYYKRLEWLPTDFLFTRDELISKLPTILPRSSYHGDLTLENIMFVESNFYLIDPMTTDFDSFVFDIAKLRQDITCKWFIRNHDIRLDTKLQHIELSLKNLYPTAFDDGLLILMLLRVLKYCKINDNNYKFLMREIERAWKNINS